MKCVPKRRTVLRKAKAGKVHTMKATNNSGIAKMLKHRAEVNDYRQANSSRTRKFWDGAIRYDAPLLDEDGDPQEDRSLSDRGKGAARIYSLGLEPAWLTEFNRVVDSLDGTELKVVVALFRDMRPARAARLAGVGRRTVYRVMDSLRVKLGEAYRLWQNEE